MINPMYTYYYHIHWIYDSGWRGIKGVGSTEEWIKTFFKCHLPYILLNEKDPTIKTWTDMNGRTWTSING